MEDTLRTEATAERPAQGLRGHILVLDGVRGLAILMVLVLHFIGNSTPTNPVEKVIVFFAGWGVHGVDLFFVLSGFLITGILFDARQKPDFFRNFYMRRLLRIFPLYYGVLALLFFVLPLVPAFQGKTLDLLRSHQLWAWLYAVNVFNALHAEWALPYIDHFWSLAVEEQFYLAWPFVVWGLGRRPRTLMAASLMVAASAVAARVICAHAGLGDHALYVLTPFRLDGLALGGFLAILARQPGGLAAIARWLPRIAAATVTAAVLRAAWVHSFATGLWLLRPLRDSLITLLLASLIMWAVTAPKPALVSRFFTSRLMIWLGTYSYGLYVYHHFFSYYFLTHGTEAAATARLGSHALAVALMAAGGLALSGAVAWLSHELFEKRFLVLKSRFEAARGPAPASATLDGNRT